MDSDTRFFCFGILFVMVNVVMFTYYMAKPDERKLVCYSGGKVVLKVDKDRVSDYNGTCVLFRKAN